MTLTAQDVETLLKVLSAEPQLRLQLSGMIATDLLREVRDVLAQTADAARRADERMAELAAAQARTEERLTRVEAAIERLAEAQARTEERLTRAEAAIERLAEAQARTEERLDALTAAQVQTERQLQKMAANLEVLNRRSGRWIEADYRDKAAAYFGEILRRVRTESPIALEDTLEAHLTTADFADVLQIDALVKGTLRTDPGAPEVWLAVEVSAVVDRDDVARAVRRAGHLRRAGLRAIPVVAGEGITRGAREAAAREAVLVLQDGRREHWEEAVARYAAA